MVIQPEAEEEEGEEGEEATLSEEQAVEDILMTNSGRETPIFSGERETVDKKGKGREVQTGTNSEIQTRRREDEGGEMSFRNLAPQEAQVREQVAGDMEDIFMTNSGRETPILGGEWEKVNKGKGQEVTSDMEDTMLHEIAEEGNSHEKLDELLS